MWWRRFYPLLFAIAIIANLFELASLTILPWNGDTGVTTTQTTRQYIERVSTVAEPAASAGLRVGDMIDERATSTANGFRNPLPATPYTYVVQRGQKTLTITVVPVHATITWDQIVRLVGVLWVLIFAFMIVMRGAQTKENDYLALVLLIAAVQSPMDRAAFPDAAIGFTCQALFDPTTALSDLALASYALLFGRPISVRRRTLFAVTCVVLAVAVVYRTFVIASYYFQLGPDANIGWLYWPTALLTEIDVLLPLLNLAAAMPAASLEERSRLGWVIASFVPFLIGVTVGNFALSSGVWFALQNASFFLIPAGLTYAALARRLFDVGFVLNRAAVFAAISTLIVGAFVLLEWALGKWFEHVSHAESLAINSVLALAVGLSIRVIHRYVDRAIDTIFFRKRHENERALRRFAHEVTFFTDVHVIVERTERIVLEHTDAVSASVVLAGDLHANDPAVAAAQAWNEPIDLHRYDTAIAGEIALPMRAHGTFVGMIVCGKKRSGETFAPDELDALKTLAHGVSLAIYGLHRDVNGEAAVLRRIEQRLDAIAAAVTSEERPRTA